MGYLAAGGAAILGGILSGEGQRSAAQQQIEARNQAILDANEARRNLFASLQGGNFQGGFGNDDVFGTRPEAVPFQSIDLDEEVLNTISGNLASLPAGTQLAEAGNAALTESDLSRMAALFPNFRNNLNQFSGVTSDLLRGQLPFEDILGIASDRNELAGALGTPGGSQPAVLADLGLNRLDAINQGSNMFQNFINTSNAISPVQDRVRPTSGFLSPQERIQFQTEQNILEQQSAQSAAFLNAAPDPAGSQLFSTEVQAQLVNAGLSSSNLPQVGNFASSLGAGLTGGANIYAAYLNNRDRNPVGGFSGTQAGIGGS